MGPLASQHLHPPGSPCSTDLERLAFAGLGVLGITLLAAPFSFSWGLGANDL